MKRFMDSTLGGEGPRIGCVYTLKVKFRLEMCDGY
jgi:hypothetical protein